MRGVLQMLVIGLGVLIAPGLLVAQEAGPSASASQFEWAPCPFDTTSIDAAGLRCGYLVVPEHRGQKDARSVRVAVAVWTPANAAPDPVVLLPGGPGGAPLPRFIQRFRQWVPPDRAVIVFDPRGTGYSGGPMCPELGDTYSDIAALDVPAATASSLRLGAQLTCRNRLLREEIDLGGYNSTSVALDLRDLRKALGYRQWNLVGASYGVPFGRAAMRVDEQGVRSAVLGFGPGPDLEQLLTRDVPFFHRALNRVFRGCEAEPACVGRFPRLEEEFYQTYDLLQEDPFTISVDPDEFRSPVFTVNSQDFVEMVYWLLSSETDVAHVPAILRAFHDREADVVRRLVEDSYGGQSSFSSGMGISVTCYDAHTPESWSAWQTAAAPHPDALSAIPYYLLPCDSWSAGRASPEERSPPVSRVPALVVQGEFDPMNPPQVGIEHLRSLAAGHLIVIPGLGHMPGSRSSECWAQLVQQFIESPHEPLDASCTEDLPPVRMRPGLPGWADPAANRQ
ncbi:MAG TPA: alpha/beta fold hydrolase [Longimicrobiales bacterium]|nr:alpha/beta fold hydrolase [Longimicrobiales bacterium]